MLIRAFQTHDWFCVIAGITSIERPPFPFSPISLLLNSHSTSFVLRHARLVFQGFPCSGMPDALGRHQLFWAFGFSFTPRLQTQFRVLQAKAKNRKKARWIFVQKKQLLPILSSGAHDMMNEGRIALATYLFSILLASKYSIQCKAIR